MACLSSRYCKKSSQEFAKDVRHVTVAINSRQGSYFFDRVSYLQRLSIQSAAVNAILGANGAISGGSP